MMAIFALAAPLFAAGKKESKLSVTFHLETEATDNPKMIFPQLANGQTRYFRRTSEVNLNDIESFSAFPSDVGEEYGVIFKLKGNAARRISALSNANQGRWMVSQVNGRVVDGLIIDKAVDDGYLVIWKGVTLEDTKLLDKAMPRMNAKDKKKK